MTSIQLILRLFQENAPSVSTTAGGSGFGVVRSFGIHRPKRVSDEHAVDAGVRSSDGSGKRAECFDDGPGDGLGAVDPAEIHRPGPSFGQHVGHRGIDSPAGLGAFR